MKCIDKEEYIQNNSKDNRTSDSTTCSVLEDRDDIEIDNRFLKLQNKKTLLEKIQNIQIRQNNITSEMVRKVVDWLFSYFWRLDFENEVIFMCLEIMRRYLKAKQIQKNKLFALTIACLYITSKFTQVKKLKMNDVLQLSQNIYTSDDIVEMEYEILTTIDFNLDFPTFDKYIFCESQSQEINDDKQNKILFWLQLSLLQQLLTTRYQIETFLDVTHFVTRNCLSQQMKRLIQFGKTTQFKYIIKRYMSYFDVEDYLKTINLQ